MIEHKQLIRELDLIGQHLAQLEAEMMHIVGTSREGRILSGSSYVGWVPKGAQSGSTLDWTRLSSRGVRQMKQTMYLIVWRAIQWDEGWKHMYERLISRKCRSDERTRRLIGREKVIGRLAGQMASVIYTRLEKGSGIALAVGIWSGAA